MNFSGFMMIGLVVVLYFICMTQRIIGSVRASDLELAKEIIALKEAFIKDLTGALTKLLKENAELEKEIKGKENV